MARGLNADIGVLSFEVGDAENLASADGAFDVVANIESSHCYGNIPRFTREVARVQGDDPGKGPQVETSAVKRRAKLALTQSR